MALFRIFNDTLERVHQTTFVKENLLERSGIQRLLKSDITALNQELMVISEEFGDWEDSNRRLDLLCLDQNARLVVVEIKRTEDGGHMELQAIRYAAMVSSMTLEQLVAAHARFIGGDDAHGRSERAIVSFLGWNGLSDNQLSSEVRIVLVSANFSVELTTSVLWLNKQGLNIFCYRIVPHRLGQEILINIEQLIPLPEAADYETKLRAQRMEIQRVESGRAEILRRFWTQFIEFSNSRTKLLTGKSPVSEQSLLVSSGKAGLSFIFTLKRQTSRVELYIDYGKGTEGQTLEAFRGFESNKDEIETAFKDVLTWQELPESRACRICYEMTGGWQTPIEEWGQLQERIIDAMCRLEVAIRPHII